MLKSCCGKKQEPDVIRVDNNIPEIELPEKKEDVAQPEEQIKVIQKEETLFS